MGKANLTFGIARLGKVPEIWKLVLVVLNSRSIDHQHVKSWDVWTSVLQSGLSYLMAHSVHTRGVQGSRTGGTFSKHEFIPVNIYILTAKISQSMVASAAIHTGSEGHLLKLSWLNTGRQSGSDWGQSGGGWVPIKHKPRWESPTKWREHSLSEGTQNCII